MMRPTTWYDAVHHCQHSGQGYVLVTLLASAGSTPRDSGTKMVITADSQYDTIGGGHLEHQVVAQARELLASGNVQQHLEHFPLSSRLGQCCGGATNVLFDVLCSHQQQLAVFGAGHVAKALIPILAQLPLQICWVDDRADMFTDVTLPANVTKHLTDDPTGVLSTMPSNSWALVMTHNHQLDFELVERALQLAQFDYIGMIGSDTKARRFVTRLAHKGFTAEQCAKLVSPVGDTNIPGKRPIEVAVSISAQLIQRIHSNTPQPSKQHQRDAWRTSKALSQS